MTPNGAPDTLGRLVERLGEFGDRPALIDGAGTATSYRQLVAGANRLANALLSQGVTPGEPFAFLLPNGTRIVECYFACATTGIIGVPLAARLTLDDLVHQLEDSGAVALLYDEAASATVDAVRGRIPGVRHLICDGQPARDLSLAEFVADARDGLPGTAVSGDDPFCVMFTGGTTGTSKAAVLTQVGWACCVIDTVEQFGLDATDRHAAVLPMTHAAWFTVMAHLHVGAVTHILDRWDPKLYLDLVERERLTTLHMIPTLLGDLIGAVADEDVSTVRLLTVAGSPMPIEMYERAREVFGDILGNIYGLTEATGPVSYLVPADMTGEKIRSGGRAGRFVEIGILGREDQAGESPGGPPLGEIVLRGPQITPGYMNRPEENATAFRDGWFCTGDVGYLDAEGFLFILDRVKDMIKSGGFNVYPKEVEEVLYRHPGVLEAAVIGLPDPKWIEAVTAIVVVRDQSTDAADLAAHCREHLVGYKVPKSVHLADALPRTAFGKFDKRELQRRFSTVATEAGR